MKKYLNKQISALILFTLLLSASSFSQTPKLINYQAVARSADGSVITNEVVDITINILQGSSSGTAVCSEAFSIESNDYGIINLQIGSQNPADFSAINWANGPYYVEVKINDIVMGTSQLLSVPYALYAENTSPQGTSPGEMKYWDGSQWQIIPPGEDGQPLVFCNGVPQWGPCNNVKAGEPIFKLDGPDGYDIMAVYPGSVEFLVEESADPTKTSRGGFAIGGFTTNKSTPENLLHISPDSVRVYIKEDETDKTSRGGFAIGGFTTHQDKNNSELLLQVTSDTTFIATTVSAAADLFVGGDVTIGGSVLSRPVINLEASDYSEDNINVECFASITFFGEPYDPFPQVGFEFSSNMDFEEGPGEFYYNEPSSLIENSFYAMFGQGENLPPDINTSRPYYIRAYAINQFSGIGYSNIYMVMPIIGE